MYFVQEPHPLPLPPKFGVVLRCTPEDLPFVRQDAAYAFCHAVKTPNLRRWMWSGLRPLNRKERREFLRRRRAVASADARSGRAHAHQQRLNRIGFLENFG